MKYSITDLFKFEVFVHEKLRCSVEFVMLQQCYSFLIFTLTYELLYTVYIVLSL